MTKEEQKILQEYIEKIYMAQQQCYGKYHTYSKDNQEKLLELEKKLKTVGYEIFDILKKDIYRFINNKEQFSYTKVGLILCFLHIPHKFKNM